MRRRVNRLRHKFVPGIWENSALSSDGAEQSVKHEQGARDRPAMADPGGHTAPVVTTQFCSRNRNDLCDLFDCFRVNAGFLRGKFESVISVELFQGALEVFEVDPVATAPGTDSTAVVAVFVFAP